MLVAKAQRPVLPQTAVLADAQGSYVFVVTPDNKVTRHAVHVSGVTDAAAIVDGGLAGTERVVATAGGFLHEGEAVQVAATPAAPQTAAAPTPASGAPAK